jgi:ER lumen protein retaining receptor
MLWCIISKDQLLLALSPAHDCRTYRGLYILNWIYRYMTEAGYRQWLGKCAPQDLFKGEQHMALHHSEACSPSLKDRGYSTMSACTVLLLHAVWISGIVQTIIYCDFFYYYIKSWRNNEKLALPA